MSTTSPEGILACSTVLPPLGIVVVGLRFHARLGQKAELRFDDWAQIPALVRSGHVVSHSISFILVAQA